MRQTLDQFHTDEESAADTVLPAQFWVPLPDPRLEPEKRLMVAVLEEAISLVLSAPRGAAAHRRGTVAEAVRWMASDDRSAPFAFASICDVLGLDLGRVRDVVTTWRERRCAFRRPRLQAGRGRHRVRSGIRRSRRAA